MIHQYNNYIRISAKDSLRQVVYDRSVALAKFVEKNSCNLNLRII